MKNILCPICRENITDIKSNIAKCKFCDAVIFADKSEEYYSNIDTISFARNEKNFSEGEYLANQTIQSDFCDSLAYWLLFLSKYGITYIKTPLSAKKVPSFSKSIENIDFLQDEDYLNTINSEKNQEVLDYYISQAKLINDLFKKISALTSRCKFNDIYISAKRYNHLTNPETNEVITEYTEEYHIALKTYEHLKSKGFNVFFSPIDAVGTIDEIEFSAIIHSAIYQSKIFLLFTSELKNIQTQYMKDDWYKYIFFMRNKMVPENSLFLCYKSDKGKIPFRIPQEFQSFVSMDYTASKFYENLFTNIAKTINPNRVSIQTKTVSLSSNQSEKKSFSIKKKVFRSDIEYPADEEKLMNLGLKYLRSNDFESAKNTFNQLKDLNDKNFMAYFGNFLVRARACGISDLTHEKLLAVSDYKLLETSIDYVDATSGKKILDRICLSLKNVDNYQAVDNIVWIFYIIAPYIDDSQKQLLKNALSNIQQNFVRKNAINQSTKIYALLCMLSDDDSAESDNKKFRMYIKSLMDKKQFKTARNILIDFVKIYETADNLLNLLKATLGTNNFMNFVFKYKPSKNNCSKLTNYSVNELIPRIIAVSFYTDNIKPLEELRMLCYTQIEKFNLKTADLLLSDIISYMLILYPADVVTRFLLKCANKFSNSGDFDRAIKYSKLAAMYDEKNCQAYFEMLRATLHCYDDYDFVNYEGNIKEYQEFKKMYEIAQKYNNIALIKRIDLLLKYQSQPKGIKTPKAFPRVNYKKVMMRNNIKKTMFIGSTIIIATVIVLITLIMLQK